MEMYMLKFISGIAINDALIRTAYKGDKNVVKEKINSSLIQNMMKEYIDNILDGREPDFKTVTDKIMFELNDSLFSFGNAQKYVSMYVKYVYIMTYKHPELRKHFNYHPAPMDSIMIKHICDRLNNDTNVQSVFSGKGKDFNKIVKLLKYCTWSNITKFDDAQFIAYQDAIKILAEIDNVNPIEYDYKNWK